MIAVFASLLFAGASCLHAATITNVATVNVTPAEFSLFWHAPASEPSVEVFADESGSISLAGQLEIEVFPVHTGDPDQESDYARRQSRRALQDKSRGMGLMLVRVSGCHPGTTYYYRLTSKAGAGNSMVYPESGPLPSVTTEIENTFVVDDQLLVLDVPGLDTSGQVVMLTHPDAAHPLAAVVGDGADEDQVIFNLNDLFHASAGGNFAPVGEQTFEVTVMGPNQSKTSAQFLVTFGPDFTVSQPTQVTMGTEFVASTIGSTVFQAGQEGSVQLTFNSSVGLASLDLKVRIPSGSLTNFTLKSLAPEIDPVGSTATLQQGSNLVIHLAARPGQAISGVKQLGELAFTAGPGQNSAFVPLKLHEIVAAKPGASLVTTLFGQSGRAVIVGTRSLLEIERTNPGNSQIVLYAKPWSSCAIEYATNLTAPIFWTRLEPIAITNLVTHCAPPEVQTDRVFYRAVEFVADPPLLKAVQNPDRSRSLLVFGEPSQSYVIEYKTSLSAAVPWKPLQTNVLENSFSYIGVSETNGMIFYRLRRD